MEKRFTVFVVVAIVLGVGYYASTLTTPSLSPSGREHLTGQQTISVTSTANIQVFIAVSGSATLQSGIDFGTVDPGTQDNNATGNFDGSELTEYSIDVLAGSNVNADFCIRADTNLSAGPIQIPYPNYRFANETVNSNLLPDYPPNVIAVNANATFIRETTNVAPGSSNYYRFYLDVPPAQAPGLYQNNIIFQAVRTGTVNQDCLS
jgi:hypothetical protein